MDNISNLSSNLPPTKPINDESIKELNSDLALEFKNAAKSVASLYKLSLQKNSMLRYKGYLDCIDDLLNLIKNEGDVENWALMKKLELEGKLTGENSSSSTFKQEEESTITTNTYDYQDQNIKSQPDISEIQQQALDYNFSMTHPNQRKFPQTMPIMSVDHSNHKDKLKIRNSTSSNSMIKDSSSDASDLNNSSEDEIVTDDSTTKRKLQSMRVDKRMKH